MEDEIKTEEVQEEPQTLDGLESARLSVAKLEATLKKVNQKNRELEKNLKGFQRLGKQPEELESLLTNSEPPKKLEAYEAKLREAELRLQETHKQMKQIKIDSEITALLAGSEVLPSHAPFIKHQIQSKIGFDETGNLVVLDENNEPETEWNGEKLVNRSPKSLLEAMKQDETWAVAFRSKVQPGSGMQNGPRRNDPAGNLLESYKKAVESGDSSAATKLLLQAQRQGIKLT